MSISDLNEIHEYMLNTINDNNGKIDKIYFCPHLESENCFCRKPSPGMIQKAFQDYPDIDRNKSYFIGDSDSDMQAGKAEKLISIKLVQNILFFTGLIVYRFSYFCLIAY